jgi:hypothetical protein
MCKPFVFEKRYLMNMTGHDSRVLDTTGQCHITNLITHELPRDNGMMAIWTMILLISATKLGRGMHAADR